MPWRPTVRPPRCTGRGRPSGRRVQQKRRWVVAQFAELQPPPVPERDASRICTTRCMVMLHAGWAPLPTARPPISLSLVTLLPQHTSKVFGKGRSTLDHLFHRAEAATSSSTSTAGGKAVCDYDWRCDRGRAPRYLLPVPVVCADMSGSTRVHVHWP
jgi:hypothetical protein